jgi:hypothetical protein
MRRGTVPLFRAARSGSLDACTLGVARLPAALFGTGNAFRGCGAGAFGTSMRGCGPTDRWADVVI